MECRDKRKETLFLTRAARSRALGFSRFCQSGSSVSRHDPTSEVGAKRTPPPPVLAPGSALGSLPSVALSSVQVEPIIPVVPQHKQVTIIASNT